MRPFLLPLIAVLAAVVAVGSPRDARASVVSADHLDLELVSEHAALVPGARAWLGLRLRHAAHWHSYWINPGDSGLPTRLAWTLPQGWRAGDVAWPAPTRFEVGGLYNFGYDGDVLLPVPLEVPVDAVPGTIARLGVEVRWLVCREECVPGKATLALDAPIAAHAGASPAAARFAAARLALPQPATWTGSARREGERIAITLRGDDLPASGGLDVFARERRVLGNSPPTIRREGDVLIIDAPVSDVFDESPATLTLVLTNGSAAAREVRVPFESVFPPPRSPSR
jgi:thiol:disulfide interchange protein DsbD